MKPTLNPTNPLDKSMLKSDSNPCVFRSKQLESKSSPALRCAALVASLGVLSGTGHAAGVSTNVHWKAEAEVKEAYDSNVYLQDVAPAGQVPGAVPAKKGSFVTTVSPRLFADYSPCTGFKALLSYTPDFNWYESAHSEDNLTHRWGVNSGGKVRDAVWALQNSFIYIDGSKEGPIFGRPGDVPAIGGVPLRNRRAAFIYKSGFRVTQTFGKWMVRPVASAYVHDFKTDLHTSPAGGVYENYIDRQDINGGLDVGYEVAEGTHALLGYRYGRQNQFKGPFGTGGAIIESPFGNAYHRVLVGAEGSPFNWLKLNILVGPEFRRFDNNIPGYDRNETLCYVDAAASVLPSSRDVITLSNRRYEQPAFSSFSVYEDITYDLLWNHKFDGHWAGHAGFRLYVGDWQTPVNRNDWIYTISAGLSYAYNNHLSAEAAYSYDWAENMVSTTAAGATYAAGREFTRHLASLAVKCAF